MRNSLNWLFALAMTMLMAAAIPRAEIIDRILAVIDGAIITQSDLIAAVQLGFVEKPAANAPMTAALDSLIERRLILIEVDRYAPPEPADAAVDRRVAGLRAKAGSEAEFQAALQQTGLSVEQLRRQVRDDLRIASYLDQRFGTTVRPSEADILQYYRAHEADFTRNGVLRSYADAHDDALAALDAERRAATIGQWIAGLRRRANVNVLPISPAP